MIRTSIKSGAARILSGTGLDRMVGALSGVDSSPLVIGYHRVVEDFARSAKNSIPSMLMSRRMLEQHLEWIGKRYRFVDLNELGAMLEAGPIEEPVAAITFDDGYSDFYEQALPVLQSRGIPSALFVVTDLVGTTDGQIHDKLFYLFTHRQSRAPLSIGMPLPDLTGLSPYDATRALLEKVSFDGLQRAVRALQTEVEIPAGALSPAVTWDVLKRIQRAGVVIGSHTRSHVVMPNETVGRVFEETRESRRTLESKLGIGIVHFAYPSGIFNETSLEAASAAGYKFGYTSCTHRSAKHPLLTVPRTVLWEDSCVDGDRVFSDSLMSCQVNRAFGFVAGCRQQHEGRGTARVAC